MTPDSWAHLAGWAREAAQEASSPGSYPNDLRSISPVDGTKAHALIERAWTSSPMKVVISFIAKPLP